MALKQSFKIVIDSNSMRKTNKVLFSVSLLSTLTKAFQFDPHSAPKLV